MKPTLLDEELIIEAVLNARKVQEYIWQELSYTNDESIDIKKWIRVFKKRVDKISELDAINNNYKVELRKRILQQAALSIAALFVLDKNT